MISFHDYFNAKTDESLLCVLNALADSGKQIVAAIHKGETQKAGTENASGEEQIALDVQSDQILTDVLSICEHTRVVASEEKDAPQDMGRGEYAVVFDPLDGSSLFDVNLSIGTIFGVYKSDTVIGVKPADMVAAGFIVYGPRTTMMISIGDGTHEFQLDGDTWMLHTENVQVAEEGKMFAPGNLGAVTTNEGYKKVVNHWMTNGYQLRYSGGMVPDINQILLKGKGIFAYPGTPEKPEGKLRLLYECGPMAYLMTQAGGGASDGSQDILSIEVSETHQRTPIFIGSKKEVETAVEMLG